MTTDQHGHEQTVRFADGQCLDTGPARVPQWMVTLDHRRELAVPIGRVLRSQRLRAAFVKRFPGMPGRRSALWRRNTRRSGHSA